MNLPHFNAQASLGPTMGIYGGNAVFGELGAGKVLPVLLRYNCDSSYCTCTGDDDCNDMFSSDVCGPTAICQINSANIPKCRCKTALSLWGKTKKPYLITVRPPITTGPATATTFPFA
jgi:hypothetical protein